MSDSETLFMVLAAIYLFECLVWVPRGAIGFRSLPGGRWHLVKPGMIWGSETWGLLWGNPLPPLGGACLAHSWPLAISPETIYACRVQGFNPGGWLEPEGKCLPFQDIETIEASSKNLHINQALFVKAGSISLSEHLAQVLTTLSKLSVRERERKIKAILSESLDVNQIKARLSDYRQQTRLLRLLCNLLFLYTFIFAPRVIWVQGVPQCWWWLASGLFLVMMAIAVAYNKAHTALYPDSREDLVSKIFMLALSPPASMRAGDHLARNLLIKFHPLAIAYVLCQKEPFLDFARLVLRDVKFPLTSAVGTVQSTAQEAETWFRNHLRMALEKFLRQIGENSEELTKPPAPANERCFSYCPRCQSQYMVTEGECSTCGGLPLHPLHLSL